MRRVTVWCVFVDAFAPTNVSVPVCVCLREP